MDLLTIHDTTWRGVAAWRVEGRCLVLIITRIGGHLAALWDRRDGINPLWQPPWAAADPTTVAPDGEYGEAPSARTYATIVGHNWCCDRFGAPWPGETRPLHGEAGIVAWDLARTVPSVAQWQTWLPEAQLHLRTTIRLDGSTVELTHAVAHDRCDSRDVEWCEHVNVGGVFLDGARFTAGIDRVRNGLGKIGAGSRFAAFASEADLPIAQALAMPEPTAAPSGEVLSGRVRDGWWSATHRGLRRRLTYRWRVEDFPWLVLWTQDRGSDKVPWSGRTRVRGMEISTKPWPEGKPPASRAQVYSGRPTTCSIPPGRWREHRLRIDWESV